MRATFRWTSIVLALLCVFGLSVGSAQAKKGAAYQTGFDEWPGASGDFAAWTRSGVALNAGGELVLDPATAVPGTDPYPAGGYYGGNFYNGGSFLVGEATGPEVSAGFDLDELIASWNAVTPDGTWVEVLVRAELDGRWTKWYNLGIWASGTDTVQRHSVRLQGDADGYVSVDTLVIGNKKAVVGAYQLSVRLFSADGLAVPSVRYLSAAYSTTPVKKSQPSVGNPANWGTLLPVPECSQMVYEGGNVWCSPTSTSMVVAYWMGLGNCSLMPGAADGIYDWVYDGTGNWPFNTAYAATFGLQASVRRFTNMNEIESWVKQGVPVVFSYAWNKGDLTGAAVGSSSGHLSVIVGFDASGNPIVNDPAAATNEDVQRTYLRSELESLWLSNSGGTVYLIKP
jgi:Peptidase_C39 like family